MACPSTSLPMSTRRVETGVGPNTPCSTSGPISPTCEFKAIVQNTSHDLNGIELSGFCVFGQSKLTIQTCRIVFIILQFSQCGHGMSYRKKEASSVSELPNNLTFQSHPKNPGPNQHMVCFGSGVRTPAKVGPDPWRSPFGFGFGTRRSTKLTDHPLR